MTSRERFELVVDSIIKNLNPTPARPNDWVQHTFDGEKLNVTVIPREQVYFDTCDAGPQLAEYQAKAGEQNAEVLAIFHAQGRPLSPSQVANMYPPSKTPRGTTKPPLTSIRRAISTLTKAGALVKTEVKRKGMYGRSEFVWRLPEAGDAAGQEGLVTRKG